MSAKTRHTPTRLVALAAALAALSMVVGGCTTARKEQPIKTTQEQALAECSRVTTELKAFPGVTDATCYASGYGSNIIETPKILVSATINTTANRQQVTDRSTELAWLSNLHPLYGVAISIEGPERLDEYTYRFSTDHETDDAKELT